MAREEANGVAIARVGTQSEVCPLTGASYKAPWRKEASHWKAGVHVWSLLNVKLWELSQPRAVFPAKLCVPESVLPPN